MTSLIKVITKKEDSPYIIGNHINTNTFKLRTAFLSPLAPPLFSIYWCFRYSFVKIPRLFSAFSLFSLSRLPFIRRLAVSCADRGSKRRGACCWMTLRRGSSVGRGEKTFSFIGWRRRFRVSKWTNLSVFINFY